MSFQPASRTPAARDESIDARRYLATLRRSLPMMAALVIAITGVAIVASLVSKKTYQASAEVIVSPNASSLQTGDGTSEQRQLATIQTLVTSPAVLDRAAKTLHTTRSELQSKVSSTLDPNANLIRIQGSDGSAARSAAIPNAVANAFIANQAEEQTKSIQQAQSSLDQQIANLRSQGDTASIQSQVAALQQRQAELAVQQANTTGDLQLAREAEVPSAAATPRPARNAVLALFVSLFIAVLAALARDQFQPVVSDQREASDVLDLPILTVIPERPSKRAIRRAPMLARVETESYRTLSAGLRLMLKSDHDHILLTTSAMHAEGKTSVTLKLSRVLAEAGRRTLIVSADLRWPRLDHELELDDRRGFSDLLDSALTPGFGVQAVRDVIVARGNRGADVMPSGTRLGDGAASLLTAERLTTVFATLTELGYDYVLVDAPPLLGLGDTQLLAAHCDEVLVVSRLKGLKLENLVDLRATLDRLQAHALGLVVIGGHMQGSPYYTARPEEASAPATSDLTPDDVIGATRR
jgi:capsular polysaccharide biosynthesis protein